MSDEAQLDPHLNSASVQALRQARLEQHNIFRFYFHSLQRAVHGDLGTSLSLGQPVSTLLRERAPLNSATGGDRTAAELGRGDGDGAQRGMAAGIGLRRSDHGDQRNFSCAFRQRCWRCCPCCGMYRELWPSG